MATATYRLVPDMKNMLGKRLYTCWTENGAILRKIKGKKLKGFRKPLKIED